MRFQFSRLDALLLLMAFIWGGNYSLIKSALHEIPPIAFNTLRLTVAATLFLATMWLRGEIRPLPRRDWIGIALFGFVGQFVYQLLFMRGLSMTSAANSSLIIGCTPVFVAVISAVLGHERITIPKWSGVALSAVGIYLVVGHGASLGGASVAGDLTMLTSVFCWSAVTVGARPLLARHSPVVITGYGMTIGSLLHVPVAMGELRALQWSAVSGWTWLALFLSAALALYVSYIIWYTALHRLGNTHTSIYSNLVPIAGLLVAWLWLGDPVGATKVMGAAAIIGGVLLTKIQFGDAPAAAEPA